MPEYTAVIQVYLSSEDDLKAQVDAYEIEEMLAEHLEQEQDAEKVELIEVISDEQDPRPIAQVATLQKARNVLVRTRTKEGFELARELDRVAHALSQRLGVDESMANYDWTRFMELIPRILNGEDPL